MRIPNIHLLLLCFVFFAATGHAKVDNSTYKKEAWAMVDEAVAIYQSDGIDAGLQELENQYLEYQQKFRAKYVFVYAAWREAQTRSGTDDPAWGYHIFRWTLRELWSKETTNLNVAANLANIQKKAIEAGFIGTLIELRELHIKSARHHYYGSINVELTPTAHLRYKLPRFPDPNAYDMPVVAPKTEKPYTSHEILDLLNLSNVEHVLMNWRESYVYSMWLDKWGKTIMPNDLAGLAVMETSGEQFTPAQCHVYILLSKLYQDLGYYKLSKQYNRIVAARGIKEYRGEESHKARINNVLIQSKLGEDITESIEQLHELRIKVVENNFHENSIRLRCDLAIAAKLKQQNLNDEAYTLLDETLRVAKEETLLLLNIEALETRIRWSFEDGNLDSIEDDLIAQLQLCRQQGLKASEPELYVNYARLMYLLNRLPEAIELQLAGIDLYKSFDLYTWLPVRYEELAELYFEIGNYELAGYYSKLAHKLLNEPDAEYPDWITEETLASVDQLQGQIDATVAKRANSEETNSPAVISALTDPEPVEGGSSASYAVLDLQPSEQVCVPLAGYPATGVYTVTNYSQATQELELAAKGPVQSFTLLEDGTLSLILDSTIPVANRSLSFELQSGEQGFLMIEAPAGSAPVHAELSLLPLELSSGISYFSVPSEDHESRAAVTNAVMVRDNPFYHVSIFHVLRRLPDATDTMNLRFKASQPARIEGYHVDGTLLFVDADGDGAFHSAGDILKADQDLDGFPDIDFGAESLLELIEIAISPNGEQSTESLEVEISHKDSNGEWTVDAIDRVE